MSTDPVLGTVKLGFPWPTIDPFLFCAYHDDRYPAGSDTMGPDPKLLSGRNIGMDFEIRDGWRMYHGDSVPGFPRHPHRGFETVTLARRGYIDHSDSLGARARFGHGDVQWMTAGKGIEHCEMFPLVNRDSGNHTELFQVWLNLPAADKMVDPYFTMLWSEDIPRRTFTDADGHTTEVVVVAGTYADASGPRTPPNSWAARPEAGVGIFTIEMAPNARWTMKAGPEGSHRVAYYFEGSHPLKVGGRSVQPVHAVQLKGDADVELVNGPERVELLVLQGRPIGEPVAQQGPFVMNTRAELQQAFTDYRAGMFGSWPWSKTDPVHDRETRRFAVHADGTEERPKA